MLYERFKTSPLVPYLLFGLMIVLIMLAVGIGITLVTTSASEIISDSTGISDSISAIIKEP